MTTTKLYECTDCGSAFKVIHDLDSTFYTIQHCPFCGYDLHDDNFLNIGDNDD